MGIFLVLITITVLPAILVFAVPAVLVRVTAGWSLLGVGLVAIDSHVATPRPYDDDGVGFGPEIGTGLSSVWAFFLVPALIARWQSLFAPRDASAGPAIAQWTLGWAIPLSLLLCAAAMHWLRNRLAGVAPSVLVHLAVLGPCLLLCLFILWRKGWRLGGWSITQHFALALPASILLLVALDVHKGFDLWTKAQTLAAGRPHCLMTYGGFEHSREARSRWDLSPLVNRRYGTWAASKAPVVVIFEAEASRMYRRINGRWQDVTYGAAPPCRPVSRAS